MPHSHTGWLAIHVRCKPRSAMQLARRPLWGLDPGGHLATQVGDQNTRFQRFAQLPAVLLSAVLEVGRQVVFGVAPGVGPTTQSSLQRSCSRSAWKVVTS